mmetsp:Transcript_56603/g.123795  ORF Transcript_56603/g.123795 Transcript_56603/m.123795 type:complete len:244 (-) Transcript_56603:1353-2084(-)
MLKRMVPSKTVGSCGTRPTMFRRARSPSFVVSRPPIRSLPCRGSKNRRRHSKVVDLPQPVFPTNAHFVRGSTLRLIPCSTLFALPYPAVRSSICTRRPSLKSLLQKSSQTTAGGVHSSLAICSAEADKLFTATMWKVPVKPCNALQAGAKSSGVQPSKNSKCFPSALRRRIGFPPLMHTWRGDGSLVSPPDFASARICRGTSSPRRILARFSTEKSLGISSAASSGKPTYLDKRWRAFRTFSK